MQRLTPGQVFRGRYVLEAMLGRGGMGSVWRARDRSLGRHVALKFMAARLEGSAIARKRFEREAHATAKLQSRHVVRVHDHGVEEATPFIVMELLEGEDLGARLLRLGRVPVEDATRIVLELCRGLRSAHEAGLIHRDLKPANIFLARQADGTEIAKILDFGVVKATASTFEASVATESGAIVGSVQYASPEQAEGHRDLDARSDLWSVTAVAFRMLTGRLPFPGDGLGAVVLAICSRPLPRATDVAPELPSTLDSFFARGFERDRGARFQTAMELADALATAAGGVDLASVEPAHDGEGDQAAPTRIVDLGGDATRLMIVGMPTPASSAAQASGADSTAYGADEDGPEEVAQATRVIERPSDLGSTTGVSAVAAALPARVRPGHPAWLPLAGLVALAVAVAAGVGGWLAGGGGRAPLLAPAAATTPEAPLRESPRAAEDVLATAAAPPQSVRPSAAPAPPAAAPPASASSSAVPGAPARTIAPPRTRPPAACRDARGRRIACPRDLLPSRP